ncbi:Holliday junction resolvase RuvX [Luteolibacter algae]|uniref:Putative pre-16S rRNA nuclease n=1 Tax=Luteolibacter algae TaxID=454151 RepID=A0ABW5DAN5_9BACT
MNTDFPHFSDASSGDASPHPALGIDYGEARIGVAATDEFGIMAHPVETVATNCKNPIGRLTEIASQRKIKTLIVGLPLRLDGTEGSSAEKVRSFAKKLGAAMPEIPMFFVDETYTTSVASEKLRAAGRKAHQQKKIIDQAAAVEILNQWMEEAS